MTRTRLATTRKNWLLLATTALFVSPATIALAEMGKAPAFTQSVLPLGDEVLGVSIGPGGPDVEFGLSDTNGGIYRLSPQGYDPIVLSDGKGLRNPTALAHLGETIFTVDGAEIIAFHQDGTVLWRVSDTRDGVFFYDMEVLNENQLLVGDFGNGRLLSVDPKTGAISDYAAGASVPGLARFEISDAGVYAVSWGSDDAWDGVLWVIEADAGNWSARQIATGFGNAEAVAMVEGEILVGGYRGHETAPDAKLVQVDPNTGDVRALVVGGASSGVSDIAVSDGAVWLSYLRDGQWEKLAVGDLR